MGASYFEDQGYLISMVKSIAPGLVALVLRARLATSLNVRIRRCSCLLIWSSRADMMRIKGWTLS